MYHRFLSFWLVAGVLLATTLIAPRGAAAGPFPPTCYGTSCNGQNPLTSYCSEGSVIVGQVGLLTRYYSPACNAYWGHLRSDTYIVVSAWMENNQSATIRTAYAVAITNMWASGRVCGTHATFSGCV